MSDITDAAKRLRHLNEVLAENDSLRAEILRLQDELVSATRHMELAEAAWLRETSGNSPLSLRLTVTERIAVETSFDALQYAADELGLSQADCDRLLAALRGLTARA